MEEGERGKREGEVERREGKEREDERGEARNEEKGSRDSLSTVNPHIQQTTHTQTAV